MDEVLGAAAHADDATKTGRARPSFIGLLACPPAFWVQHEDRERVCKERREQTKRWKHGAWRVLQGGTKRRGAVENVGDIPAPPRGDEIFVAAAALIFPDARVLE